MDIYAIRKNKYAGVYTKKEVFEYIKGIELRCSIRIFQETEKKEALKWAGVDNINIYHSSLESDKKFKKLLAKLDSKDIVDVKETEKEIKSNLSEKTLAEGLHKYQPMGSNPKGCVNQNVISSSNNIIEKESSNIKNGFNVVEIIDKYKKDYTMFMIKTLSFGDLYYLCDFWYYEKPWDIEYGYTLKELVKYGYINYKLGSKIVVKDTYLKVENIYKLDKSNELEELFSYQKLMFLSLDEIRGIIPIEKDFLSWYSEGEYHQFMSGDLKSKELKELIC